MKAVSTSFKTGIGGYRRSGLTELFFLLGEEPLQIANPTLMEGDSSFGFSSTSEKATAL
jgi:hypothetical protein